VLTIVAAFGAAVGVTVLAVDVEDEDLYQQKIYMSIEL
jgi:hypothetical protein